MNMFLFFYAQESCFEVAKVQNFEAGSGAQP